MFAKLKKRIAAVETDTGGMLDVSSTGPSHVVRRKIVDDISDSGGGEDSISVPSTENNGTTQRNTDELLTLLLRREKQVKRLQIKISENEKDLQVKVEETEDLQEKQIQESAKIKHLLLNTQEELSRLKEKLKQKATSLIDLERQFAASVNKHEMASRSANTSHIHVEQLTIELSQLENEKNIIIRELTENQELIQLELEKTKKEMNGRNLNAMSVDKERTELVDKLEQITHLHDTYRQKAETQSVERTSLIEHLQEKVWSLEIHKHTGSMSDSEQVAALLAEKKNVDQRLEESRQQLSDIKTTWSDRITQLEQQIAHLNSKIVEDASEISTQSQFISHLKTEHTRQIYDLNHKLVESTRGQEESREKEREMQISLQKQCEQHNIEVRRMEEKQGDTISQLHTQIDELEEHTASIDAAREFDRTATDLRINELTNSLKDSHMLATRLEDSQLQVEQLQTKLMLMQQTLADNNRLISDSEIQYRKLTTQLQAATQENSLLKKENSSLVELSSAARSGLGDTITDNNKTIELLNTTLTQRDQYIETLLIKISQLEHRVNLTKLSESLQDETMVSSLHTQNMDYEAQLAERNKTIKILQQRLTDMKKLLHRELKLQPLTNNHLVAPSNNNDMHHNKSGRITPVNFPSFRSHSNSPPSNLSAMKSYSMDNVLLDTNDVNFKYLKHVIFKFMLCTENEAHHLIRAVSVLLKFSTEEEDLIKQTLEWKSSWFRARPTYSPSNPNHT